MQHGLFLLGCNPQSVNGFHADLVSDIGTVKVRARRQPLGSVLVAFDFVGCPVDGEKVAETDHPVLLDETGMPTRYYIRREDVRMDLLRRTSFKTECPFKGHASYWTLELGDAVHDGIVWSYETPIAAAEGIAGLLCFYNDRVDLSVSVRSPG